MILVGKCLMAKKAREQVRHPSMYLAYVNVVILRLDVLASGRFPEHVFSWCKNGKFYEGMNCGQLFESTGFGDKKNLSCNLTLP